MALSARSLLPFKVRHLLKKNRDRVTGLRSFFTPVRHRSAVDNVYHCCVHKTGSQWIRAIFKDPRVYKYSDLKPFNYQTERFGGVDDRRITERSLSEAFPLRTVVTPIYIDYRNYAGIPKPEHHRAFFVMRDPRDVVVSWYFSSKYSHGLMGGLGGVRKTLAEASESEGLCHSVRYLSDFGLFAALASWVEATQHDPNVTLVRFEDIAGEDATAHFRRLFDYLDIAIPDSLLAQLLDDYSFERLSKRQKGNEDPRAHYRKGIAGDWSNHFDDEVGATFQAATGDLLTELGYE